MKEKDFIELYRTRVESRNEAPPDSCWDEISTQLDIEESWDYVSMELDKDLPLVHDSTVAMTGRKLGSLTKLALVIAPVVLLLLIMLSDTRKPYLLLPDISAIDTSRVSSAQHTIQQNDNPVLSKSEQHAEEAQAIIYAEPGPEQGNKEPANPFSEPGIKNNAEIISKPVSSVSVFSIPGSETGQAVSYTLPADSAPDLTKQVYRPVISDVISSEQPVLDPIESVAPPVAALASLTMKAADYKSSENVLSPAGKPFNANRFSIGMSLTEKNTWLISQETLNGLDRQDLSTTKATFLNDIGIILRYNLNERWSFEGTTLLLSKTGQSYNQYIYGIFSSKVYELKYLSFEMSARYALHNSFNNNNLRPHFVGGAYISHLTTAYKTIGYSVFDVSADYDPIDYGLLLGYELEIKIREHLAVTPGIRIKCGIPNIFADQPEMPDDINSTRTGSLEFRLNFIFPL